MAKKKMLVKRIETAERALIDNIVRKLSKVKEVEAIYLFGSYASGKHAPFSDIDICVITGKGVSLHKKAEMDYTGDKVQVSFFWELPTVLQWRVLNEGKLLFMKNKEFIETLKWRIFKEYTDFKPLLNMFIKYYLPGVKHV